jgi:hypothetical protein
MDWEIKKDMVTLIHKNDKQGLKSFLEENYTKLDEHGADMFLNGVEVDKQYIKDNIDLYRKLVLKIKTFNQNSLSFKALLRLGVIEKFLSNATQQRLSEFKTSDKL